MTNILDILICPLCHGKLSCEENSLKCSLGHTFDIAKSGYVNLLPPGKGKNAHTGDERDMVRARVDFLSCGYYDELDMHSANLISESIKADELTLIDMGAGEGRHTLTTTNELIKHGKNVLSLGFDASKYASECGMKKSRAAGLCGKNPFVAPEPSLAFFPANIFSLPVCDSSADVCLSMFAPIPWEEAYRILKKNDSSMLLVLSSGKEHLIELRELIYDKVNISDSLPVGNDMFKSVGSTEIKYTAHIKSGEDIKNLFMMTPFYYKTTEEGRNRLYSRDSLDVTVNVNYTIFKLK